MLFSHAQERPGATGLDARRRSARRQEHAGFALGACARSWSAREAALLLTTLVVLLLAPSASAAEPMVPAPPASPASATSCAIASAAADAPLNALSLDGSFACDSPTVFLGLSDGTYAELFVTNSSSTFVDVELPAGTSPGTYTVNVQCGVSCFMDVTIGAIGPQGIQGDVGPQGVQGEVGPQGIQGDVGPQGLQGEVGLQGIQGDVGLQGVQGEVGPQGIQGDVGLQGVQGEVGPQGIQGDVGPQGLQGEVGPQGMQGEVGPQGAAGSEGLQGEVGPRGEVGPQGPEGDPGSTGPAGDAVSADGQTGAPFSRYSDSGNGTVTDGGTGLIWLKDADCFGHVTWTDAIAAASDLEDGRCGLTDGSSAGDWRLPTHHEWQMVIDQAILNGCTTPGPLVPNTQGQGCWLEDDPFTNQSPSSYWTSSVDKTSPSDAWYAETYHGLLISNGKENTFLVWPVRQGGSVTGPVGPQGIEGIQGTQGIQGETGPQGPQGENYTGADLPRFSSTARFLDNGNGTVTDGQTGLIWLKDWDCPGYVDWVDATDWAAGLEEGQCGLSDGSTVGDWRLPTIYDWVDDTTSRQDDSMDKQSCPNGSPNIPDTDGRGCFGDDAEVFNNVAPNYYWAATVSAANPAEAWVVYLYGGGQDRFNKAQGFVRAVAVRGGP